MRVRKMTAGDTANNGATGVPRSHAGVVTLGKAVRSSMAPVPQGL
jgi:hypothetical protein